MIPPNQIQDLLPGDLCFHKHRPQDSFFIISKRKGELTRFLFDVLFLYLDDHRPHFKSSVINFGIASVLHVVQSEKWLVIRK